MFLCASASLREDLFFPPEPRTLNPLTSPFLSALIRPIRVIRVPSLFLAFASIRTDPENTYCVLFVFYIYYN
jgi:hypothetical protein